MSDSSSNDYGRLAAGMPTDSQRRATGSRVKDIRDRLTSDTGTRPQFDRALLLGFAELRLSSASFVPVIAFALAAAGALWLDVLHIILWLSVVLCVHAGMLFFSRKLVKLPVEDVNTRVWSRRFVVIDLFQGISWASFVALPVVSAHVGVSILSFIATLMVIAASATTSAALPVALLAATLPMVMAFVAVMVVEGQTHHFGLAAAASFAMIYFFFLAKRLQQASLEGMAMRAEKDVLITELEQARRNAEDARKRAEAANIAKSRFLATMSHELRTPLNAILGFSEVMKGEVFGPLANPSYKEYASDIHSSGQHLLNLINEILDLSRVEAGRFELNEEPVNLVYSAEDSLRLVSMRARNKGVTLQESFEEGMPNLWADSRSVHQIFLNLLSNAIKFTPSGGTVFVKVGWTRSGGQYLSVRDTGSGIPDDEIPTVLSSFGQGTNALKNAEQGAGLGLPIVQGFVELHGGTFSLKSKVRVGTEVLITFPNERVMKPLAAIHQVAAA
jgi:two-component system, cell cycle sensor histidine kinase PleC